MASMAEWLDTLRSVRVLGWTVIQWVTLTFDFDFRWGGSDSTPALPFSEFAGHGWN